MANTYTDLLYARRLCSSYRNYKETSKNSLNFACPFCGDSQKDRKKARGNIYINKNHIVKYKCFNCGIGPIPFNVFLKEQSHQLYKEYLYETFEPYRKNIDQSIEKKEIVIPPKNVVENIERVSQLNITHHAKEYLIHRKIPESFFDELYYIDNFREWVNGEYGTNFKVSVSDQRIVIPCIGQNNELIGLQGRALNSFSMAKYLNVKLNHHFGSCFYGLNNININKLVLVVEGSFDSMFLPNCVAVSNAGLEIVDSLPNLQNKIFVWDNDRRNKEIYRFIEHAIEAGQRVVIWPAYIKEKDINEMILSGYSRIDILNIIKENIYSGLKAKLKLKLWKK